MVTTELFEEYRSIFLEDGVEMTLLGIEEENIDRMKNMLISIESHYLFPIDDEERLYQYSKKLIDHAYTFIFHKEQKDVAVMSFYANDTVTKTAYTSTIGIIPSFRGGALIRHMVPFALQFAREIGMEKFRAEVHKENKKWLNFLIGHKFRIVDETDHGTFMILCDL